MYIIPELRLVSTYYATSVLKANQFLDKDMQDKI